MKRSDLIHIIRESIKRQLLNEGDSRLNKVMRIIADEFNGLLDINGTVTSSEYYVNNNPNTTWGQYLLYSLRHNFGLMTNRTLNTYHSLLKLHFLTRSDLKNVITMVNKLIHYEPLYRH